jgi:dehydrogenase/reductase SDR family protein 7
VALITGAGGGIGEALALRWASMGVKLALNDINAEAVENVKSKCLSSSPALREGDVLLVHGDVTSFDNHPRWLKQVLDHFGHLDILVNNAGRAVEGQFASVPMSLDKAVFDLNVMGPVSLAKTVLPHFLARGSGQIVQISSNLSRYPAPNASSYAASKAAVWVTAETIAVVYLSICSRK